jgi:hypothetical protein
VPGDQIRLSVSDKLGSTEDAVSLAYNAGVKGVRMRVKGFAGLLLLAYSTAALADERFSDVVQIAPDTYSISRTDHGGIFGNAGKMKTAVMKEAQDFAASLGKVAVARHVQENPLVVGRSFASVEYVFWVLDKNDADARREDFHKDPALATDEHIHVDVQQKAPTDTKKDVYTELLKLDDLHKRGILTDAEFEQQKQKVLSQ